MVDQIMVIEGIDGFSNLEGRGIPRDTVAQIAEKLKSVASRREAAVRSLEARLNMMRRQLDKLDRTPGSREAHVKLYDQFVNLGKLHDLEKRLAIVTVEKHRALKNSDMNEYKRLVIHERTLTKFHKSNKEFGPRVARAVTAASAALKAKRAFVQGKDDARTAQAAHSALIKSRAELVKQYKELKKRLRALSAIRPSDDRNVELSRVQEALRVTRRGLAQTKKTVKAQRQFMEQRQFVKIGMEHENYPRSTVASAVDGFDDMDEVDESVLSGFEIIEVDINDLNGFMDDIKSAGESVSKAKSEVDSYSKEVDNAQKAIGSKKDKGTGKWKGDSKAKKPVTKSPLKPQKKFVSTPASEIGSRMKNADTPEDERVICKEAYESGVLPDTKSTVRSICKTHGYPPVGETDPEKTSDGMSLGAKIGIAAAALAAVGGVAFVIIKKKRAASGVGDSYAHDLYEDD